MDIEMNEVPLGRIEMCAAYEAIKSMYLARTEGYVEAKKKEGWVEYDIIEHCCSIDNLEGRYLVAPEANEQVAELCKLKKLQLPIQ